MKFSDLTLRLNLWFNRYRAVLDAGHAERVGDTWEEVVNPSKPPRRYIVTEVEPREGGGTDMTVDEYDPEFNFRGAGLIMFATLVLTVLTIWLL